MTSESSPLDHKTEILQIHSSAEIFVEKYGRDAPRQARLRADELIAVGNRRGGDLWLRIYLQTVTILSDK